MPTDTAPEIETPLEAKVRQVPRSALRFSAGDADFGDVDPKDASPTHRIPGGVARTGDAINHHYWGKVVHDNTGWFHAAITLASTGVIVTNRSSDTSTRWKPKPVNWSSKPELMSVRDDDNAFEVIKRGRAGHPYELSIDFNGEGLVVEEYAVGETATAETAGPSKVR